MYSITRNRTTQKITTIHIYSYGVNCTLMFTVEKQKEKCICHVTAKIFSCLTYFNIGLIRYYLAVIFVLLSIFDFFYWETNYLLSIHIIYLAVVYLEFQYFYLANNLYPLKMFLWTSMLTSNCPQSFSTNTTNTIDDVQII